MYSALRSLTLSLSALIHSLADTAACMCTCVSYVSVFSAHNAAYHGLAGIRAGVNMAEFHKKRSPDEFYM